MDIYDTIKEAGAEDALANLSLENIKNRFDDKSVEILLSEFKRLKGLDWIPTERDMRESKIPATIKKMFGINLQVSVYDGYGAGVPYTDFSITATSPLQAESIYSFSDNGQHILRKRPNVDIRVNRVTGKITGVEDILHTVAIGSEYIRKGGMMSHKEACAIFLHEVGHIWTYYYVLPHIFTTAFFTGEFAETLVGMDSEESRTLVLKSAEKELGMEILERERLIKSSSKNEISAIMFASEVGRLKSIFGTNPYEKRNSEAMADQFVVRLGLGRYLSEAMVKNNPPETIGSWGNILGAMTGTLFNLAFLPMFLIITLTMGGAYLENEYDNPAKRSEVILQQLRGRYKTAPTKALKAQVAEEIDAIEAFLSDKYDARGFLEVIYAHVLPWGRGQARRLNFAMALESLANNKLTTRAEKLRQLGM